MGDGGVTIRGNTVKGDMSWVRSVRLSRAWRTVLVGVLLATTAPVAPATADRTSPVGGPSFAWVGTEYVAFEGHTYFAADDGSQGRELWRTDGTAAGTELVADLFPGDVQNQSRPHDLTVVGDRLYFTTDGPLPESAWFYDGTAVTPITYSCSCEANGAQMNARFMGAVNGRALFNGYTGGRFGQNAVAAVGPGSSSAVFVGAAVPWDSTMAVVGGFGYFGGAIPSDGKRAELYRTDGVSETLVAEIAPGDVGSNPESMVAAQDRVFFLATTAEHGRELWTSDGTGAGTVLVRDHRPGATSGTYGELEGLDGGLAYVVTDPTTGTEVWHSDGTSAGTRVLADIVPGPGNAAPRELTEARDQLLFMERGNLWRTDGSPAGTRLVRAMGTGLMLTAYRDQVYFRGSNPGDSSSAVWRSDGTPSGTVLLSRAGFEGGGPGDPSPGPFGVSGDRIYFSSQFEPGSSLRTLFYVDTTRPDPLTLTRRTAVKGEARVGETLTAKPPRFSTADVRIGYQWLANGKRIKKATSKKLVLTRAMQGKRISVRATGRTPGSDPLSSTSRRTKKVAAR